jgi:hypothetical protein
MVPLDVALLSKTLEEIKKFIADKGLFLSAQSVEWTEWAQWIRLKEAPGIGPKTIKVI